MRFIVLLLLALEAGAASAAGVIFRPLGDLPGGAFSSQVFGLSPDGATVVGRGNQAQDAFYWTLAAGIQPVPAPENLVVATSMAEGASNTGLIVATGGPHSYVYNLHTGVSTLIDSATPSQTAARAYAINAAGDQVAGRFLQGGIDFRAFVGDIADLSMQSVASIHPAAWTSTDARAMSDNGVAVGLGDPTGLGDTNPFVWSEGGGLVEFDLLPGFTLFGAALSVSGDGAVPVGQNYSSFSSRAVRWVNGVPMDLGLLPGTSGNSGDRRAYDASHDGGVIVGRASDAAGADAAFVWDETAGMRSLKTILENDHGLDLTGWTLSEARAVSADGMVIAGTGTNPDGSQEAWLVDLSFESPAGEGDLNGDGLVTIDDYEFWRENFGAAGSAFYVGGGNGDGVLDVADYTVWRDAFGGIAPASVPEPMALGLLLATLTAAARRSR